MGGEFNSRLSTGPPVLPPNLSVRKEIKIRPGFTPQEDVSRFRGSRQQAADRAALPKGHIMGWVPPSSETKPKPKSGSLAAVAAAAVAAADTANLSKTQKKNAKRAAKRAEKRKEEPAVKENWDDDDDDDRGGKEEAEQENAVGGSVPSDKVDTVNVDAVAEEIKELKVE